MTESLQTALLLLIIGMITVFSVLFLLVMGGRGLIAIVNKFFPDEQEKDSSGISPSKIAVLTAAVENITEGRGRISDIEKL
ncbi:MAG: OadG family protein [Cyclobacteriaceae bacterium]|nr:OadG family protein [Cyclobacteriaceae bacterium]